MHWDEIPPKMRSMPHKYNVSKVKYNNARERLLIWMDKAQKRGDHVTYDHCKKILFVLEGLAHG